MPIITPSTTVSPSIVKSVVSVIDKYAMRIMPEVKNRPLIDLTGARFVGTKEGALTEVTSEMENKLIALINEQNRDTSCTSKISYRETPKSGILEVREKLQSGIEFLFSYSRKSSRDPYKIYAVMATKRIISDKTTPNDLPVFKKLFLRISEDDMRYDYTNLSNCHGDYDVDVTLPIPRLIRDATPPKPARATSSASAGGNLNTYKVSNVSILSEGTGNTKPIQPLGDSQGLSLSEQIELLKLELKEVKIREGNRLQALQSTFDKLVSDVNRVNLNLVNTIASVGDTARGAVTNSRTAEQKASSALEAATKLAKASQK
jgi:hypothetical protein